ncbi:TMEM175 family protein [Sphingomonas sp.]|uniref:TMEM175 family protein n=1 Tax=Sphingomonas sp. TaxID=28214 RepID=UPI001B06A5DA|nr:TMEM175 family protein [Sphingomonas sp.]MBO9712113.1 DUF1211 domain-containing protein [Sphingomonas sp.]
MSEPESLATEEALTVHIRRHGLDRLIMVSDGVFAIAVTLAAIEIHMPHDVTDFGALVHAMTRPVLGYLVSFAVAAIFWISHRDLFARLRRVDAVLTVLTLILLALVALIPATVGGVYLQHSDDSTFKLWATTMVGCGTANSAMWLYAAVHPSLMLPDVPREFRWTRAILSTAMPLIFLTVLFLPQDSSLYVLPPLAVAALVMRRVVLPRLLGRDAKR